MERIGWTWEEATVVCFTKLSQYWHSTRFVNYEKPTGSQGQKVEPGVSRIRSKSAATTVDIRFMVQLRLVVKGPLLGNLLTNSLFM
jgi:hypothetical protein